MMETDLNIIFWFVLGTFTLGAAVLTASALINVMRLRNVRLSWKAGKLQGYPLFSSLFLLTALIAGGIALYQGGMEELVASGLYTWLGICWFTTSLYATKRFITDHGIVKNVNEPSQTVAWHQIRDFVEQEGRNGKAEYIFIYGSDGALENEKLIRLELDVPGKQKKAFQKLISHKLGRRIRCYMDEDINIEQFGDLKP